MALVVKSGKESPSTSAGDMRDVNSISWWGRSSGEGNGATHSCFPAWRIPCREEPGGLHYTGSQRVGYNRSNLSRTSTMFDFHYSGIYFAWSGFVESLCKPTNWQGTML